VQLSAGGARASDADTCICASIQQAHLLLEGSVTVGARVCQALEQVDHCEAGVRSGAEHKRKTEINEV
jgi:hypothetical protein